jgi:gingipain R
MQIKVLPISILRNKKVIYFITILVFIMTNIFSQNQYQQIPVILNSNHFQINIIESENDNYVIEYIISEFFITPIEINGEEYYLIDLEKESRLTKKGATELPIISRSIMVDSESEMKIEVLDMNYTELDIPVPPSQDNSSSNINPDMFSYPFSEIYSQNSFYPSEIAELSEPYQLSGSQGISIHIKPFQYHPVQQKLRIYTSIKIRVYNNNNKSNNS